MPAIVRPHLIHISLLRSRRGRTGIDPEQSRERAKSNRSGDKHDRSQNECDRRTDCGETRERPDPDQQ
jgi:hypothetical protein